jgi:hypothetical protein
VSEAVEKLRKDLTVLEAMADEMEDYLISDVLYWPLMKGNLPRLTLGAYLMRQHRLTGLRHLLDEGELDRLNAAVGKFNLALVEKVVRFEEHAHQELRARLRQWGEFLKDLGGESDTSAAYYAASVETRAIIAALAARMKMPPYELDDNIDQQIRVYDSALRRQWMHGEFVWPVEWRGAYPTTDYWWLYGRPR